MGNKLSCSCAPLIKKTGYRYEDSPWNPARRRDGHLLRLWAEVFHVSSSGAGQVKWQQVSEDLVPVNITCIQDTPECVFHITAYNSQVDKILDVRLIQPGTRIGQASECFVYWKDPATSDTWGLNFTSPIDAKQFRECCPPLMTTLLPHSQSPSFKFSRKASSSYSLKLEPVRGGGTPGVGGGGGGTGTGGKNKGRRKPVSTPASPSRTREPQCTCMTAEQYARLRAQDPRYRVFLPKGQNENTVNCPSTLPRTQGGRGVVEGSSTTRTANHGTVQPAANTTTTTTTQATMCETLTSRRGADTYAPMKLTGNRDPRQPPSHHASHASLHPKAGTGVGTLTRNKEEAPVSVGNANDRGGEPATPGGGGGGGRDNRSLRDSRRELSSKSVDYSEMDTVRETDTLTRRNRSKSTDDVTKGDRDDDESLTLDSNTLKKMLKPITSTESPLTSPESWRRRVNRAEGVLGSSMRGTLTRGGSTVSYADGFNSEPEAPRPHRLTPSRSAMSVLGGDEGTGGGRRGRGFRLDLGERESPPSDHQLFDLACYATTPSSSNSDFENNAATPSSPTSQLLQEYEMHLRNTLAKGMDAESYSLHTFEALLTQSMENLESIVEEGSMSRPSSSGTPINSVDDTPRHSGSWKSTPSSNSYPVGVIRDSASKVYDQRRRQKLLLEINRIHMKYQARHTSPAFVNDEPLIHSPSLHGVQRAESLGTVNKYGTLPASQRGSERSLPAAALRDDREHSGYFSDRNDSYGSRRDLYDRGYMSDHDRRFYDRQDSIRSGYMSDRERGYTSDRDSRGYMSDRERSGYMSDRERGYVSDRERGYVSDRERGYMSDRERGYASDRERGYASDRERGYASDRERGYASDRERGYASDRERGYMSDRERGYMSDRERGYMSDRERGYMSDRDSRGYASDRGGYGSDRERGYSSDREHSALVTQASMESADSRLCYLTSSEMSDDDRMSLTTAVSEDEDGESVHNSPYKAPRPGTTAASFNCTGAVRKAGFLSVKKWLLRKKHQIELARKRGWKGYWVCLKGTTLLFYPCDSREGRSVEAAPKHLIIVDGAIMQPIPEHPKRDYIFCLSTAFGDAYLFQAPCQVELENWVNSIHSACAAAFARHRGKTGTLHLLQEEIFRIDRAIESDSKLKHMAELQLSVVSDAESKQQIMGQIMQWEENLERLHCEQFRLRCYMASLQTGELPNPKGLLTHVSRTTKTTLNRLGVFTVSSFHAYICARSPSLLNNLLAGRGATKRRAPMLSRSNSVSSRRSLQMQQQLEGEQQYKVNLPDNQTVSISLKDAMTVEEFLVAASSRKSLNPMEHFVRVKKRRELEETNYFVPHRTDLIENYLATHEVVEICAKILYQVELSRSSLDHMWGFSVEAELIENSERQDELCCYISRVEDRSTAMQNGIIKGDEIMVINGAIVSDLDMMYIESVLQEELALCLMMRSSRTDPPDLASLMKTTDEIIESLVCPPPPTEISLNEEMISRMIVPAPSWSRSIASADHSCDDGPLMCLAPCFTSNLPGEEEEEEDQKEEAEEPSLSSVVTQPSQSSPNITRDLIVIHMPLLNDSTCNLVPITTAPAAVSTSCPLSTTNTVTTALSASTTVIPVATCTNTAISTTVISSITSTPTSGNTVGKVDNCLTVPKTSPASKRRSILRQSAVKEPVSLYITHKEDACFGEDPLNHTCKRSFAPVHRQRFSHHSSTESDSISPTAKYGVGPSIFSSIEPPLHYRSRYNDQIFSDSMSSSRNSYKKVGNRSPSLTTGPASKLPVPCHAVFCAYSTSPATRNLQAFFRESAKIHNLRMRKAAESKYKHTSRTHCCGGDGTYSPLYSYRPVTIGRPHRNSPDIPSIFSGSSGRRCSGSRPLCSLCQQSTATAYGCRTVRHPRGRQTVLCKEPASPDGFLPPPSDTSGSNVSSLEIENLLRNSDLGGGSCRSPVDRRSSPTGSIASTQSQSQLTPSRQLSDGERLKKVILELVDTEKSYVKHLNNLLENYLEPLKSASFLSSAEVNALFGNIREIVAFQRLFLQALQEALDMEPGFPKFDQTIRIQGRPLLHRKRLPLLRSQFKLYSSFCASHSKAQKVLHPSEGNQALQEFLASRNPRQQHSATLESYLIKPIQRILKYPLLLQQLKALTTPGSDEHRHLVEALKVMEKVAEHINEMQRIHEEYGAIFDHLFRQHQKSCKQEPRISHGPHLPQPIDLSPGDLLYYGGVEWLNISDFLGKIKKGLELHAMCFVFKTAVVFLCKERLRQKKKLMVSSVVSGAPGKNSSSEVEIIRYQVLIPVTEVQVRASSMKDMDSHFLWELIHLKSQLQRRSEKVYHLSNSTSEFRNAFLKTIRQIIRESVRNMNIPANKPSSSSSSVSNKGNTNTLQPSRSAQKKKTPIVQSATLQRHSAGNIDYDNLESYDNVPETQIGHDQSNFRTRSKTMSDGMDELSDSTTKSDGGKDEMGTRSEGEEEVIEKKKATLGRTPNHLSLSTTSTLSTGSTGSMAKLIQASNQPSQYQPVKSVGSPVWKPRDTFAQSGGSSSGVGAGGAGQRGESLTLPRAGKASGREDHFLVYEEYGGNIYMSSKKDSEKRETIGTTTSTLVTPIQIKVHGGFEPRSGGFPTSNREMFGDIGINTSNGCYIITKERQEVTKGSPHRHRDTYLGKPTHITNGQTKQTVTHIVQTTIRPASMNGGPSHLHSTGPSPREGAASTGRSQRLHGGTVKSSPWPGFPYAEEGSPQIAHDLEGILPGGMTIDSLLQQLRALS
ncbi:protein still life, isoform SIF type 1 isoform X2 [Palaemon carinicauda]|uniref:protein still life, isoform SIF type 1 isoform X2 n=1 Tax=Palaemon carinicauda TaxID=392227 RepID=UPI0035B59958